MRMRRQYVLESRKHCIDLMLMSCLAFISIISSDLGKCFYYLNTNIVYIVPSSGLHILIICFMKTEHHAVVCSWPDFALYSSEWL